VSGIEVPLTQELRAAVLGEPLPSNLYLQAGGLASSLTSGGSANWPPMGWAVAYLQGDTAAPPAWRAFFQASRVNWMGDEWGSFIYGRMHLLAVAAVAREARKRGDADLEAEALGWLQIWWGICALTEAPNGRIMLPGMRCAGHEPLGGWREWLLALARGDGGGRARAEAWGHAAGLAMPHQWEWATALALEETLRLSYQPLAGVSVEDLPPLLTWGFITLHVYRTPRGIAAWLEENRNGNTPPWMAGVSIDGQEIWAPAGGGARIRERFDHAEVERTGQALHYRSTLYPEQMLLLPAGEGKEVVLGVANGQEASPSPGPVYPPNRPGKPLGASNTITKEPSMNPIDPAPPVSASAPTTDALYRSIPVWLRVGLGAYEIIYKNRSGGVSRASWTPADGGADSPAAGTLVGERYSRQLLEQVIRAGGLPLPPNYVVTDRDDDLLKLVAISDQAAWDALVVPAANKLGVSVNPGTVAPNAPAGLGMPTQGGGAIGAPGTGPGDGGLISHPDAAPLVGVPVALPVVPLPTNTEGLVAIAQAVAPDHAEADVVLFGRKYRLSLDALA
jgi:hypothetical protein